MRTLRGMVSQRKLRTSLADGRPLSSRLVPPAGNPLRNTVSEREADDQSNCNFQHWEARQLLNMALLLFRCLIGGAAQTRSCRPARRGPTLSGIGLAAANWHVLFPR